MPVVRIYSIATVDADAKPMWHHKSLIALFQILLRVLVDLIALTALAFRRRRAMAAEILVLRRQIALYKERGIKPRRVDPVTRVSLALLLRFCNWRDALVVVRPATMIRWHRAGWKLFWRLKSRPDRPPIPIEIQTLIRRMANENPSWGEERIANELLVRLGIQVSPRTVSKYRPRRPRGRPRGDLRWSTFLRLHAQGIIACDFLVAVTATFRLLYVFVAIEYEYLLHDRDRIFATHLDQSIVRLGAKVLRTPPRSPMANAICERVIGTIRRECLDWLIPLSESHLRSILKSWIAHYNRARPHMALGPGVPNPPLTNLVHPYPNTRHRRGESHAVHANPILGGLHHEYVLAPSRA